MIERVYTITLVEITSRIHTFPKCYTTLPSAKYAALEYLRKSRSYELPTLSWHKAPPRWTLFLPDACLVITEAEVDYY